jgi:hypothetical protein
MTSREPELSRRRALSGLAAAAAISGLTQPARASQPMVNVQVPAA